MNNLGVLLLRGLGGSKDEKLALEYLLKSALQMTSTAFGHIGRIFESCTSIDNPKLMAQLFFALERHLLFDEAATDENNIECLSLEEESKASFEHIYTYTPLPIEKYFHIETIRKISHIKDYLPLWNLCWLATSGLDESVDNPGEWHTIVHFPAGLVDTLLFDMDSELAEGVSLRNALTLHPERFLHFFRQADVSVLEFSKRSTDWKEMVIAKAEAAASHIGWPAVCLTTVVPLHKEMKTPDPGADVDH